MEARNWLFCMKVSHFITLIKSVIENFIFRVCSNASEMIWVWQNTENKEYKDNRKCFIEEENV